jgi:hypothetical protein
MKEEELEAEDPFFLNLNIRCTSGNRREFTLRVEATATVDQFKQQVRSFLGLGGDQNLRLIFNGKLLGPDSCTVESTDLRNNSYVHAVISPNVRQSTTSSNSDAMVGDRAADEGAAIDGRGLNSLLMSIEGDARHRLSREQVHALRAYFAPSIREYAERHLTRGSGESEEDFNLRAETEWMAAQPTHSEFRLNLNIAATHALFRSAAGGGTGGLVFMHVESDSDRSNSEGTCRDFFFGLSLGYALGIMMIFCVWDANVPYRQKLGILTGIMIQIVVGMILRKNMAESSGSSSGSLRGSDNTGGAASSPI